MIAVTVAAGQVSSKVSTGSPLSVIMTVRACFYAARGRELLLLPAKTNLQYIDLLGRSDREGAFIVLLSNPDFTDSNHDIYNAAAFRHPNMRTCAF